MPIERPLRILLLGASGFAGSHLRRAAEEAGHEVVGESRSGSGGDLGCDVTQAGDVEEAIRETSPDAIANLTGFSSVARSFAEPAATHAVNVEGTVNVLRAMRADAPDVLLLAISSGEVYGHPVGDEPPFVEDRPPRPVSPYGESKAEMEARCEEAAGEGLRVCVVRAFNHIGPGQSDDFVASSFARQVAGAGLVGADEAVLATGNLSPARDFTDVRDMVRAYLAVLEHGLTGTFNACSGQAMKIARLIDLLADAAGIDVRAVPDPERMRPVDVPVSYGSHTRLTEATGWEPRIPIERTVADLYGWWRDRLAAQSG